MATIFKEVVTVNAPGQDVVFDGCDFTEKGYLNIVSAQSVKIMNCRFYSSETKSIDVTGETKLLVSYSYFGKDCIIDVQAPLEDGSVITSNYFNGGVQSISIKEAKNDTRVIISNNIFKVDSNIAFILSGAPQCTFDMFGNQFEADYLASLGCSDQTETYNNTAFYFTNNIGKNPVILEGPIVGAGAVPPWCDTENYPIVFIENKSIGFTLPLAESAEMVYNLMFLVTNSQGEYCGVFDSFALAYQNAPSQAAFTLLADASMDQTVTIEAGREIQFDLNGYTLTMDKVGARCIFNNGDLMIFNGTINQINEGAYGCIDSSKNSPASLTLQEVTIIDNGNDDGSSVVDRGGGSLTVSNCVFNSTNEGKYGNACCVANSGAYAMIENCTFDCATTVGSYPIICRGAEMYVNNCTIHGAKGGIAMDYGQIYINGGTITADNFYGCWITNDGVSTECHITGNPSVTGKLYGVYCSVDDGNQDAGNARVTIDSGTFVGNTKAAAAIGAKSTVREWGMEITGGKFLMSDGSKSDVSAYVKEGYIQNDAGEVVPA